MIARPRLRLAAVVPVATVLALCPVSPVPAAASAARQPGLQPGGAPGPQARTVLLSDELTATYVANVWYSAAVRARPDMRSRAIAQLRFLTEDGYPEVYLVLARHFDRAGRRWLRIRLPMRPNGRTGWVREGTLGPLRLLRTRLVVDTRALRATLYLRGRRIWWAPIGVGASGMATPRGRFWIRERLPGFGGLYGPVALGTAAYSRLSEWPGGGVIGMHGTDQPWLIPGRPSHGCIRVRNAAILQLARLLPVGTPLRIL